MKTNNLDKLNNLKTSSLVLNSLTLAFLGDAVYEILVRDMLIQKNPELSASKLHFMCVNKVKATAQSKAYDYIKTTLSSKELEIMKRGRNSDVAHCPKSSNPIEYHKATGLEALFGYLFLNNNHDRLREIFNNIYDFLENI